jgi:outer membrane lipopolysaccharide assembly protein LptE/RlpB
LQTLKKAIILAAVSVVSFYACGYRFADTGQFPSGVSTIFVQLFENRTSEVGIESVFTDELTGQFTTRGNERSLTDSATRSDAVLSGVIKQVDITNISKTSETVVSERRVVVTVAASLVSSNGKTVWQVGNVSGTGTYEVDQDDYEITEGNKREAIALAAERIAEMLYNSLIEDF